MLVAFSECLIVLFGMGLLHGLVPILTSETFPTRFRYSGTGISYGLSGILAGMIAPPLLSKIDRSGRCSSLALSTSHLRGLRSRCDVGSALHTRDTRHQIGRSRRSGSLRCGQDGHGNPKSQTKPVGGWSATRNLPPKSSCRLWDLSNTVNQFASRRSAQRLSIRYVSGPRNHPLHRKAGTQDSGLLFCASHENSVVVFRPARKVGGD